MTHDVRTLSNSATSAAGFEIVDGYRTGLIGEVTLLHAHYYSRASGFGSRFESVVAAGLAEFCNRLGSSKSQVWTAIEGGETLGSVAIDGEDLGSDSAHLRWFIVSDRARGSGVGRQLLGKALDFVDSQRFAETQLWTFAGLDAARHLYETHGFKCVEERPGSQWGTEVMEQRFLRPRPANEKTGRIREQSESSAHRSLHQSQVYE